MFKSNKFVAVNANSHAPIAPKIPMVAAGGQRDAAIATPTIETSKPRATIIPAAKPPNNANEIIGIVSEVLFNISDGLTA